MKLSIATKLGLGFLPAFLALLVIGWVFYERLHDVEDSAQWVSHTLEVLQDLEETRAHLAEAEGSARAYQLSFNDRYREIANTAIAQAGRAIQSVRRLTSDNPDQQQRVARLESAWAKRTEIMQSLMSFPRLEAGVADAKLEALMDRGHQQGDTVRAVIHEMADAERALLGERREHSRVTLRQSFQLVLITTLLAVLLVVASGVTTIRGIRQPLGRLEKGALRVGRGDYAHRVDATSHDELGRVALMFNQMVEQIEQREQAAAQQTWIKTSLSSFTPIFQSNADIDTVCQATLAQLALLLHAPFLVFYVRDEEHKAGRRLLKRASYAADGAPAVVMEGDTLVGQCLFDRRAIRLNSVPEGYIKVASALGSAEPREILVEPVMFENEVMAVLEVALLQPLSPVQEEFLDRFKVSLGLVLDAMEARRQTEVALKTQTGLSQSLLEQQQALKKSNEELEQQSEQLRASEKLALEQKEELQLANEEQQCANEELRGLMDTLDQRARQLAETSAFKSEFLANMSHELRTPLNSLLILSKLLADDSERPLTTKQRQYARTIHEAGQDLLRQINEVLDMARIESGKVHIEAVDMAYAELVRLAEDTFRPMAEAKHLAFSVRVDPNLTGGLVTDQARVWQIIKNLLSNAFKFTSEGGVTLTIEPVMRAADETQHPAPSTQPCVAFTISDTGIGIPPDKQAQIFEAFQQGDSGIARKYGGTGLGLSISQKLAKLLGGSVAVRSAEGEGSAFTLYLPVDAAAADSDLPEGASSATAEQTATEQTAAPTTAQTTAPTADKAHATQPLRDEAPSADTASLAVVALTRDEAILSCLRSVLDERGVKLVIPPDADTLLTACVKTRPVLALIDVADDRAESWVAMGVLKQDPRTRHISLHACCLSSQKERALRLGAASYTVMPLASPALLCSAIGARLERLVRPQHNVLVVEDDPVQRAAVLELIGNGDILAQGVGTAADALKVLMSLSVDCVVLDLGLPDMDGVDLLKALNQQLGEASPPVVVYTGRTLTRQEEFTLMKGAQALIVKGASSPERLIDEITLLLSRKPAGLSPATQKLLDRSRREDPILAGRKILVVDDDVRNIFAVSAALETYGANVIHAESGMAGIDLLQANPDVDVVLMDVMMPTIDGLEATRRIRALPSFVSLPIIALTAKAMPSDRAHCLEAGASDYLSKPVDMDRLRAMIRVWLSQ